MSKQIFVVYACDEWKSTDSMQLLMATTSVRKLKSYIAKRIEDDTFGYGDEELSKKKQAAKFKFDFSAGVGESSMRRTINDQLHNGYYDYCYDGEEI
jgi:hypothetical protein